RLSKFRGRVVVSDHSPLSLAYARKGLWHRLFLRASMRWAYARADARIAVASGVADDLATLSGLDRELFEVVHNPVDVGVGSRDYDVPSLLESRSGPVILTVGTLKQVKRHDLLIDAFSHIDPKLGATLCIVGDGPERDALVARIAAAGLEDR